jgi:sugar lactone lactonase YvrE
VLDLIAGTYTTFAGDADNSGSISGTFTFYANIVGVPKIDARFLNVGGVTVDDSNNQMFICDSGNHLVHVLNLQDGTVNIFAGTSGASGNTGDNGLATAATLNQPSSVAVENTNVYIVSYDTIRVVDSMGAIGTLASGQIIGFLAVDTQNRNMYATAETTIIRYDLTNVNGPAVITGTQGTLSYAGDGGPAASALIAVAYGAAVDSVNNILYFADGRNQVIRAITFNDGNINTRLGSFNKGDGRVATKALLYRPQGIAFDASTNQLYIADTMNRLVRTVNLTTNVISTFAGKSTAFDPMPVTFSGSDGDLATVLQLETPKSVAVNIATNKVYIADDAGKMIEVDRGTGTVTLISINQPVSMAIDSNRGFLYFIEQARYRIQVMDLNNGNAINTIAGSGNWGDNDGVGVAAQFGVLLDIALDDINNILYFIDGDNSKIKALTCADATVTTIAGGIAATNIAFNTFTNTLYYTVFINAIHAMNISDPSNPTLIAGTPHQQGKYLSEN